MSQEARRRVAAWQRLDPPPSTNAGIPERLRVRRFSEGLERAVLDRLRVARLGRFSSGQERRPEALGSPEIGRFSRGQDRGPDDGPAHLRVGSYADRSDAREV